MKFMALGGAEKIGASCYYLEISGKKLLLDCGKGVKGDNIYSPDYSNLIINNEIYNLSDIDAILISHGHFDHIGALKDFSKNCTNAKIYMTTSTKKLADLFMIDSCDPYKQIAEDLTINNLMNEIHDVEYNTSFYIDDIKVTFYEAGHIIGACMIYLETNEGNILYTGDFLKEKTNLTNGYQLPDKLNVDVMIMCATHGKHIHYKTVDNQDYMLREVKRYSNKNIFIKVSHLTKGLETLIYLKNQFPNRNIYVDKFLMDMCNRLEDVGVSALANNYSMYTKNIEKTGIYIGFKPPARMKSVDRKLSLHAKYDECVELIEKVDPKVVFIVHSEEDRNGFGNNALQREFSDKSVCNVMQGHLYSDK